MRVPGLTFVQARGNYVDNDGWHYAFAIHATANTASDTAEASYASHRTDGVSAHFYVDADSVTQALDTDRRAGHAGSAYGNNNAIAWEFTGQNSWSRARWLESIAWAEVGRVIAYIVRHDPDYAGWQNRRASVSEMRANPRVKALYGHNDMRLAWGGTDHTDPGPSFPWDRLHQAIAEALGDSTPEVPSGGTGMSEWYAGPTPAGLRGDQVTQGPPGQWPSGEQRDTVIAWGAFHAATAATNTQKILGLVEALAVAHPDISDEDIAAVKDAAKSGTVEGMAGFREQLVAAVVDALPNGGGSAGGYDVDTIKAALRAVFADAGQEG